MREIRAKFFWYDGTEMCDAQVGGGSHAESVRKTTAGEAGHREEGGKCVVGPITKLLKNKRRSLGLQWSMSEVGTPPNHNSDKYHVLAAINNNNKNIHH